VLHEIVYGAIVPVRTRRPEATDALERIVMRALERDVARRYQTMEAFSNDLQQAHRDILTGAPTAVATPTAVFTPPPLPPSAQPVGGQSNPTYTPLPPPRVPAPPVTVVREPRMSRRRYGRRGRRGRSRWATVGFVIAIVFMANWTRTWLFRPTPAVNGPRGAGDSQSPTRYDIGQTVEDAVAAGLLSFGSGSADIQMAGAKIYWRRARRTKDPVLMKKAEDAFNEAIRLGLKGTDETEARDALREIAALKTPPPRP
jgi:hypothetical protein